MTSTSVHSDSHEPPTILSLNDIERAAVRIARYVHRTPVLSSPQLDQAVAAAGVHLKAEALQLTGSFKVRGATNKLLTLDPNARSRGVVAFSAGNHGQGVAAAAKIVGCPVVVVMPSTAPKIKVANCRWWGAEVVTYDPATENRVAVAQELADARGMTMVSPFDDIDIMAGQGTVGWELAQQLQEKGIEPDIVVVNCSGGGLASGVITAMRAAFPQIHAVIVEPTGFDKMAQTLRGGEPLTLEKPYTSVLDGIGGPTAGRLTSSTLRYLGVDTATVSDDDGLHGVREAFRCLKLVLEPGGAASLGAVLAGSLDVRDRHVALVGSGGNVDPEVFARAITDN
ncbi:threonine/serine dehydratase [Rhodococcus wratislaviensis]|uniref:threonine/serine dehydratase n=1 Tax=Rhodococcus wratislaviensis TaxID=44752 RepID=UPI003517E18E